MPIRNAFCFSVKPPGSRLMKLMKFGWIRIPPLEDSDVAMCFFVDKYGPERLMVWMLLFN